MGVRGLSSFFDCNSHLVSSHRLHNATVVVDGNNFVYWLYQNSRTEYKYGGDYDKFTKAAKGYLEMFEKCGIRPLIIFDGGYDSSEWNFHKVHRRSKDRLKASQQIVGYGCSSQLVLPILVWDAFRYVLDIMNIKYAQCDYGADDQIVAIANYFECPVISQDSDFYIFDIKHGFIRLDSINWSIHADTSNSVKITYLTCSIYFVNNLLKIFPGMDNSKLPLFATLIGNDVAEVSTFETFFNNIKLPNRRTKRLKINKHHRKMIGLLSWLQHQSVEEAVQFVINVLAKNKKNSAKELLERSLEEYNRRSIVLAKFFEQKSEEILSDDLFLTSFFGKKLPHWFSVKFHSSQLDSVFLNIVGLHCVFLPTQIEDPQCPSSYECTLPLRKTLYGICLQFDEENDGKFSNPSHHDRVKHVKEYDRCNKNLSCNYIDYHSQLDKYGKIPSLHDIEEMNREQRTALFLAVMDVEMKWLQCLPEEWMLLFITIFYWLKNSSSVVLDSFLSAVLLSILFFSLLQNLQNATKSDTNVNNLSLSFSNLSLQSEEKEAPDRSIKQLITLITVDETNKAFENLQKFGRKPQHNNAKPIHIEIVHSYSQLQACFLFASYFTKILDVFPYQGTVRYLNGTFLYNLTYDLMTRKEPELYIAELLGRESNLGKLLSKMKALLTEYALSKQTLIADTKCSMKNKKKLKKNVLLEDVIFNDDRLANDAECTSDNSICSNYEETNNVTENRYKVLGSSYT